MTESLVQQDGEDYAALLRRLAEIISADSVVETEIENSKLWPSNVSLYAVVANAADEIERNKRTRREAADALERAEKEREALRECVAGMLSVEVADPGHVNTLGWTDRARAILGIPFGMPLGLWRVQQQTSPSSP